jgi:hypothetical protein
MVGLPAGHVEGGFTVCEVNKKRLIENRKGYKNRAKKNGGEERASLDLMYVDGLGPTEGPRTNIQAPERESL